MLFSKCIVTTLFALLLVTTRANAQSRMGECENKVPYAQQQEKMGGFSSAFMKCAFREATELLDSNETSEAVAEASIHICDVERQKNKRHLCETLWSHVAPEFKNDPESLNILRKKEFTDQNYLDLLRSDLKTHIIKQRVERNKKIKRDRPAAYFFLPFNS
jgi:hypothetical protein